MKRKILIDLAVLLALISLCCLAVWKNSNHRLEISLVGGFIVFAFLLWKILSLYLNANEYSERKDFVDLHAKILGSAALVVSLLFTWQGIKNNQETAENTQKLTLQSLKNTERRQIEDRYNKALEQLGSKEREARLGAIYSLGKIASDSIIWKENAEKAAAEAAKNSSAKESLPEEVRDFHWEIMQTLASYVRVNAPKTEKAIRPTKEMPTDIQAAMSVLAWRGRSYNNGENNQRLQLYGTDLSGLVLKDIEALPGSNERQRANLSWAQLYDTKFEDAKLRGINLSEAILVNASFKNADLYGADLTGTDLADADLEGADLGGVISDPDQIMSAKNWEKAKKLPLDLCKEILQRENIALPIGCR